VRTSANLRASASAAGLTIDTIESVPMPGGEGEVLSSRMLFDDPWAAARLLVDLSEEDAGDPVVRAWSLEILQTVARELEGDASGPTLSPDVRDTFAREIQRNVQEQIHFVHEPKETFQAARVTMAIGAGDCDDHARLVYALARSGGLPAKLIFFEAEGQPAHVVAMIADSEGWHYAETTIAADFGEDPLDAYERLAPEGPSDPWSNPNTVDGLGFLGLDFVTPSDVASRKTQLDGYVTALDGDAVKCAALDTATLDDWNQFVAGWRSFNASAPGFWSAGAQGRQAADYAEQIRQWQERIGAVCSLSSPKLVLPPDDPAVGTIKTVAIGAAVLGGAFVAWEALKLLPRRRR
jgi:hypothetical protein